VCDCVSDDELNDFIYVWYLHEFIGFLLYPMAGTFSGNVFFSV